MALPYNPNAPTVYGVEEPLIRSGRVNLSNYSAGVCQAIKALATEVTEWAIVPMPVQQSVTLELDRVGPMAVDVYAADPLDLVAATRSEFFPNAFTDRTVFVTGAGLTTGLNGAIDEDVDGADHSDYIIAPTVAGSPKVDFQFGTAGFAASQRVYDVQVRARVRGGDLGFQFYNSNVAAGQKIKTGYTGVVGSTGFRTVTLSFGERCPWTQRPWTSADIQLLDSTAEVRVSREDGSSGFYAPTVAAMQLVVLHGTEHRVARGIVTGVAGLSGDSEWARVRLYTNVGAGGDWTKNAGTTYYVVVRRARLEQNPFIVYEPVAPVENFDVHYVQQPAGTTPSATFPDAFTVTTGSGGRVQSKGTSDGKRYSIWLNANAIPDDFTSWPTIDSQPYGHVAAADLDVGALRQRIVAPATANYIAVRLAVIPGPIGSTEQTTVRIRNATTLVQVGGTLTLNRETITEQGTLLGSGSDGEVWSIQGVLSAAAALVSGTAYYLELSGGDLRPVYADAPHNGFATPPPYSMESVPADHDSFGAGTFGDAAAEVGFGDFDARLIFAGGTVEQYAADLMFSIAQAPAALTGFAAVEAEQSLVTITPDTDCESIDTLPLAQLSWNASALSDADFVRYEVQRFDSLTGEWSTIARLTSKSATTWWDPDARFGVLELYRVRQIRSGEVPSPWSAGFVGLTLEAPGCGLFFTVAEEQELNMAALDVYGGGPADREFTFLDRKTLVPMHGRDYQVAYTPLEQRGTSFSRTLLLNAISALTVPTFDTFSPLRELARANVSAVCVRDHEGNRWYCSLEVPSGRLRKVGELAYAQVGFVEVAGTPTPYEGRGQSLGGS